MASFYDTDAAVEQYLLFHYGTPEQICPLIPEAHGACGFPARAVSASFEKSGAKPGRRALDLGCAVGRSSFELRRHFDEVICIDFSARFIEAAADMREKRMATIRAHREGSAYDTFEVTLSAELQTDHVKFETGDACGLRKDLGTFDWVLMANLIDRLPHPARCLERMPKLIGPGGWLAITSPYTWMEEYTPRDLWLDGGGAGTLSGLRTHLEPAFSLQHTFDLPFLIREHRRKFQWSVAQVTLWQRS